MSVIIKKMVSIISVSQIKRLVLIVRAEQDDISPPI